MIEPGLPQGPGKVGARPCDLGIRHRVTGVAAVTGVTKGFGCRLRSQPPEPEVHTRVPSSPTLPAVANPTRHDRLLAALQTVPDPRDRRGVRYPLAGILALAVAADSVRDLERWASWLDVGGIPHSGIREIVPGDTSRPLGYLRSQTH